MRQVKLAASSGWKSHPGKAVAGRLIVSDALSSATMPVKRSKRLQGGGLLSRGSTECRRGRGSHCPPKACAAPQMRGADALPWSKTPSRATGVRRNLGGLASARSRIAAPGRARKLGGAHARNARAEDVGQVLSTDESREQGRQLAGGGGGGGKAPAQGECQTAHTHRTPCRMRRVPPPRWPHGRTAWGAQPPNAAVLIPESGARCGKAARRDRCGGRSAMSVPTAIGQ